MFIPGWLEDWLEDWIEDDFQIIHNHHRIIKLKKLLHLMFLSRVWVLTRQQVMPRHIICPLKYIKHIPPKMLIVKKRELISKWECHSSLEPFLNCISKLSSEAKSLPKNSSKTPHCIVKCLIEWSTSEIFFNSLLRGPRPTLKRWGQLCSKDK
jgi:hypothetical protein